MPRQVLGNQVDMVGVEARAPVWGQADLDSGVDALIDQLGAPEWVMAALFAPISVCHMGMMVANTPCTVMTTGGE